jgi:hypothetical protein
MAPQNDGQISSPRTRETFHDCSATEHTEVCMIVCEYFFKEFNARGSDEYLSAWAADVDRMADEGWEVVEHTQRLWTIDCITSQSGSETPSPRNPEGSVKRFGSLTHPRIPPGVCVSHCSLPRSLFDTLLNSRSYFPL